MSTEQEVTNRKPKTSEEIFEVFRETAKYLENKITDWLEIMHEVHCVDLKDSVRDLVKLLSTKRIQSVPVIDKKAKFGTNPLRGLVDAIDAVCFALDLGEMNADAQAGFLAPFVAWMERSDAFGKGTVEGLLNAQNLQEDTRYACVTKECTVLEAFKLLSSGAKRVLVLDKDAEPIGKLTAIVTQSDAFKMLGDLLDTLLNDLTLEDVGLANTKQDQDAQKKHVFTVTDDDFVGDAFRTMRNEKISAVAVVDDKGALIGNISNQDLRFVALEHGNFHKLLGNVGDFRGEIVKANEASTERGYELPSSPVYCLPGDSVLSLLKKMERYHVHRVYVVDKEDTRIPCGVVSLHDILRIVIGQD